jgi:hypothetical protein
VLGGGLPSGFSTLGGLLGPVRCCLRLLRQARDRTAPGEASLGCRLSELPRTLRRLACGSASGRCRGAGTLRGIVHLFSRLSRALHIPGCCGLLRRLRRLASLSGTCFSLSRFLIRKVGGLGCLVRKSAQLGDRQRGRRVLRRRFAGCFGSLGRLLRTLCCGLGALHDTPNRGVVSKPRFLSRPSGIAC